MTPSTPSSRFQSPRAERGFVLVGVVMLVVALTILGLSLFSLSSFEAQFLNESLERSEAFQAASGGLERAKFVLATTGLLDSVSFYLPADVVYTRAIQHNGPNLNPSDDSTGTVDWSGGKWVEITVESLVKGHRERLTAVFDPIHRPSPYDNIIAAAGDPSDPSVPGIEPSTDAATETIIVNGRVQLNPTDVSWEPVIQGAHTVVFGDLPQPQAAQYIAARMASESPQQVEPVLAGGSFPASFYTFAGPADSIRFYKTEGYPDHNFGLYDEHNDPTFHVSGMAVWLLPDGAFFNYQITVQGSGGPHDVLVIVTGKSSNNWYAVHDVPYPGLVLRGGILSWGVPVILVSDGTIGIDPFNEPSSPTILTQTSMYAQTVFLKGPQLSQTNLNRTEEIYNKIEPLLEAGALPQTTPGNNRGLDPVPGYWVQGPS